jgi:biopolymer transport protein ExbD
MRTHRGTNPRQAVSKYGMDPFRLRLLIAPAMASLFLMLSLCAFMVQRPESVGFRIPMVRLHHDPLRPYDCDGRAEFLRLTMDGKTWINETEIPADQLRLRVATLMEDRAERVVYVVVDSELSYGQFAEFLGSIEGATTDLHVVVVSGEIRREFTKDRVLASPLKAYRLEEDPINVCDFVYSANEFSRESVNTPITIQPRN